MAVVQARLCGTGKIISYTVPTATLSGTSTFCEFATGNLNVSLTGNSPWKYSYKLNSEAPVEVLNVSSSPSTIPISKAGTYTLVEVIDDNTCKGTTSGSANVTITPAPAVSMSGLAPAYDKDYDQMVSITGTPSGGVFYRTRIVQFKQQLVLPAKICTRRYTSDCIFLQGWNHAMLWI